MGFPPLCCASPPSPSASVLPAFWGLGVPPGRGNPRRSACVWEGGLGGTHSHQSYCHLTLCIQLSGAREGAQTCGFISVFPICVHFPAVLQFDTCVYVCVCVRFPLPLRQPVLPWGLFFFHLCLKFQALLLLVLCFFSSSSSQNSGIAPVDCVRDPRIGRIWTKTKELELSVPKFKVPPPTFGFSSVFLFIRE